MPGFVYSKPNGFITEYIGGELAPITVYGEASDKPKVPVIKIPEIEVDLPLTIPET